MRNKMDIERHSFTRLAGLLSLLPLTGLCAAEEQQATIEQLVAEMNQRVETITLAEAENGTIPRFNQAKTVACVNANFRVHADIPGELQQGLFAKPASYPALLRFANASERDDSKKDIRGLSISLSGVEGKSLWGDAGRQDFVLNSYPALFVATPEDFLKFIRARQEDKKLRFFLNPFDSHLKSLWILFKARKRHMSPLDIRYWSTVPFSLGIERVVKYSVTPCSEHNTDRAVDAGENQLRSALKAHLQQGPACFEFGLQQQLDPYAMPIEDASVVWDEAVSPFRTVATITIEDQPFDSPAAMAACEGSSFNPWQTLSAHRPLGRMNEVRRQVYGNAAKLRNRE
ncbi:catalase family protein [Candidatus Thiodiazotropha sp. CDECU1]|uniref:catalase family protein n=1 Tax=Candidatus Thiodiazotropha sp. CDECU1 TaxID=3065865 RepID=UPI002931790A|nr:catalase family protein [Candidatus Thiodiazotropha sp. CDECU1]